MVQLRHCDVSNGSATIERLFVCGKRPSTAHGRHSPAQHAERENRELRSTKSRRSAHVHVRTDRLRLRTRWELPHVRVPGYFAAVSSVARGLKQPHPTTAPHGRPPPT